MDKAIMAANERQIYFTNDEEEIRAYEMREMALMDERARIRFATDEGLAQGRREGLTEGLNKGKIEIARKMKARGYPIDEIAECTGFSLEDIKTLESTMTK